MHLKNLPSTKKNFVYMGYIHWYLPHDIKTKKFLKYKNTQVYMTSVIETMMVYPIAFEKSIRYMWENDNAKSKSLNGK